MRGLEGKLKIGSFLERMQNQSEFAVEIQKVITNEGISIVIGFFRNFKIRNYKTRIAGLTGEGFEEKRTLLGKGIEYGTNCRKTNDRKK